MDSKQVGEAAREHFEKRALKYNRSSHWVDDPVLIKRIWELADVDAQARVLDMAIGTGKIAESFRGKVKIVVGVDICPKMTKQAKEKADMIVLSPVERLPFKNNVFDACVCRQGLQFMELDPVLSEVSRVLKGGGRLVLCHLIAYGEQDQKETFAIQRLRNPARKNFFLADDFLRLLRKYPFRDIETFEYLTEESVNQWTDTGALSEEAKAKIKEIYKNASDDFRRIHKLRFEKGDIFDRMKMLIIKAVKKG